MTNLINNIEDSKYLRRIQSLNNSVRRHKNEIERCKKEIALIEQDLTRNAIRGYVKYKAPTNKELRGAVDMFKKNIEYHKKEIVCR